MDPRLRTAKSLIVTLEPDRRVLFYNFLTQRAVRCGLEAIHWVSELREWASWEDITATHGRLDPSSVRSQLEVLRRQSVLVAEGSDEHQAEERYSSEWEWGLAAGLYHFSLLDNEWMDPNLGTERQLSRAESTPPPELYWKHGNNQHKCPAVAEGAGDILFETMRKRRSNRDTGSPGIALAQLTDCLFAGMAITGEVKTPTGWLPLQMTPGGGARNPFEAFVIAREVEGLEPGVYHYSASQHSLAFVSELPSVSLGTLIAGQPWADDKAAMIVLVAMFNRMMWKYQDANAYRVALIEAGHKGQNICLAATRHGLSACPTAALNHAAVSDILGLDRITQTPVYALLLHRPAQYADEVRPVLTN